MQSVCFYFVFIFISRCRKSALLRRRLVASRQSWDADWFARPACIPVTCLGTSGVRNDEVGLLTVQINEARGYSRFPFLFGLFHFSLTRINSEMNCIAKNKCPDSQKRDTRRGGENFNAYQEQRHVYFCILSLWFIIFDTRKENLTFILKQSLILIIFCDTSKASENLTFLLNSLILSSVCVIIVTRRPIHTKT